MNESKCRFISVKGYSFFQIYWFKSVSVTCDNIGKESQASSLLNRMSTDGLHYDTSVSIRHSRMSVKPSASLHTEQHGLSDVQGIMGRAYPGLNSSLQGMHYINTGGRRRNTAVQFVTLIRVGLWGPAWSCVHPHMTILPSSTHPSTCLFVHKMRYLEECTGYFFLCSNLACT